MSLSAPPPACSDMSGVLPRIIITAEEAQDELKDLCFIIKVRVIAVAPKNASWPVL